MATTALLFGSASNSLTLITYRPDIVALLSNEAIKGFVTFGFIRILQRLDDLIHPRMGFNQCSRQVLGKDPMVLRIEG